MTGEALEEAKPPKQATRGGAGVLVGVDRAAQAPPPALLPSLGPKYLEVRPG